MYLYQIPLRHHHCSNASIHTRIQAEQEGCNSDGEGAAGLNAQTIAEGEPRPQLSGYGMGMPVIESGSTSALRLAAKSQRITGTCIIAYSDSIYGNGNVEATVSSDHTSHLHLPPTSHPHPEQPSRHTTPLTLIGASPSPGPARGPHLHRHRPSTAPFARV